MKKQKFMKKALSLFLALVCLFSVVSVAVPVSAATANESAVAEIKGVTIQNVKTKQYLNYDYGTLKNGTPLRVWPWDGSQEQLFDIDMVSTGVYRILTHASSKYAVDVYRGNSKLKAGQLCDIWKAGDDSVAQNICFYRCDDGSFILRMNNNKNLALAATSSKARVKLVKFDPNDSAQKWIFKDANGLKVDITKNSSKKTTRMENPLTLDADYIILKQIKVDGKYYGLASTQNNKYGIPIDTHFFVDGKTQEIITDETLLPKLIVTANFWLDSQSFYWKDIERTINKTCKYIDEYTDIRGVEMIGPLTGKGAVVFAQTWLAIATSGKNADDLLVSVGHFFEEAAAIDEHIDIQCVLDFSEVTINNGLEAMRFLASKSVAGSRDEAVDYNDVMKAINHYALCKANYTIVVGLTQDVIDEYNQKSWIDKLLSGTKDALEAMAEGVTDSLFTSLKAVEKTKKILKRAKLINDVIEYSEKLLDVLDLMKIGDECLRNHSAAYMLVMSKCTETDTESYAKDVELVNKKVTAYITKTWNNSVGKTVASIKSGSSYTKWYGTKYNVSAKGGYTGQCTWYALGRFYEVTGVKLTTAPNANKWLTDNENNNKVSVIYGAENIVEKSIAVDDDGKYGHVMFIEYVTYKANGTPEYVYFTECNWDANGKYNAGKDAVLQKMTYKNFINTRKPDGYIIAK